MKKRRSDWEDMDPNEWLTLLDEDRSRCELFLQQFREGQVPTLNADDLSAAVLTLWVCSGEAADGRVEPPLVRLLYGDSARSVSFARAAELLPPFLERMERLTAARLAAQERARSPAPTLRPLGEDDIPF